MSLTGNQAFGAKTAKATLGDLESMLPASPSSDRVCLKLAQILRVRRNEVALLRLDKGSLRFIFPPELRSAGAIPLADRRWQRERQRLALHFCRIPSCG